MKCKLNGIDRLVIPGLFVEKGSMLYRTLVREIIDIIVIKSEEFKDYEMIANEETGMITYNIEKMKVEKEYELTKTQIQALKGAVEKKDNDEEVTDEMLDTCVKIQKMK